MSTQFTHWRWKADEALAFPTLNDNELHVWRSPLDTAPSKLTQLQSYLSEDEQARAARFRFDHHRHHFIVGRGLLRVLLGGYRQQEPQNLVFEYGDRGKPHIARTNARSQGSQSTLGSNLQFNVSHSGGWALYAIALNRRVGIDLEEIRPMPNAAQLAQRFFTEREYAQLLAQPADQQELAFFRGWTRKEAYLKATGEGLGGLETVEVSLLENQPRQLETIQDRPDNAANLRPPLGTQPLATQPLKKQPLETQPLKTQWLIHDIPLDINHRAAVVMESTTCASEPLSIRFWDLCV